MSASLTVNDGVARPSANFHPSTWGDYFLKSHANSKKEDKVVTKQLQTLKEEVRSMLMAAGKSSNSLSLIDLIQRLGLSHHFEEEITEILEYLQNPSNDDEEDVNLHNTALLFRLLRQQGYCISCEIFNKFIDASQGKFKESLINDKHGLLSLYEASHLRMHGENILDEALDFTTAHLKAISMDSSSLFAYEVNYALKWPIYKSVPRLMARHYISLYEKDPSNNSVLLTFAKLDYNILQQLYRKELHEISRWWKDLNLITQLSFARDRIVESYIWSLGVFYEEKYSLARLISTKIIALISAVDDMYDLYGTLEEVELFTDVIGRWDINSIDKLPEYMKVLFKAIFEVYEWIEQVITQEDVPSAMYYAKEAMKRQCRAYFTETKWFHKGHQTTLEEYMKVAVISSCYYLFAHISLIGLDNTASEDAFEWILSDPMILKASAMIGRIMNDIVSHKFEQERGHVASAIECCINQHQISEQDALSKLDKQIVDAWKDIVEDIMKSTSIPNIILMRILNLTRVTDFFYKDEDGYTFAEGQTKRIIVSLVVDPLPL